MNTAIAQKPADIAIQLEPFREGVAWAVTGADALVVRAGTQIRVDGRTIFFGEAREIPIVSPLDAGSDYYILLGEGDTLFAGLADGDHVSALGGFHYAPGGNATARAGGDDVPAINPHSCWDLNYRPACRDPRGMTCVAAPAGKYWCDIYLCGTKPYQDGTSRFGVTIADGDDLPLDADGHEVDAFDHPTATRIYAEHGKALLRPEEFFAAAYGVTEATSIGKDPKVTKLDAPRTSKWGVMQATGNMSTWGGDGDPDGHRRACLFGGNWDNGGCAGSRCADVGHWPEFSNEWISARGRSDHLQLA